MTGRQMYKYLSENGIPVQKVFRKHDRDVEADNRIYTAEFFTPGLNNKTDSARVWMERIQSVIPSAVTVATHDTTANWRPDNPIIWATVIFIIPKDKS